MKYIEALRLYKVAAESSVEDQVPEYYNYKETKAMMPYDPGVYRQQDIGEPAYSYTDPHGRTTNMHMAIWPQFSNNPVNHDIAAKQPIWEQMGKVTGLSDYKKAYNEYWASIPDADWNKTFRPATKEQRLNYTWPEAKFVADKRAPIPIMVNDVRIPSAALGRRPGAFTRWIDSFLTKMTAKGGAFSEALMPTSKVYHNGSPKELLAAAKYQGFSPTMPTPITTGNQALESVTRKGFNLADVNGVRIGSRLFLPKGTPPNTVFTGNMQLTPDASAAEVLATSPGMLDRLYLKRLLERSASRRFRLRRHLG